MTTSQKTVNGIPYRPLGETGEQVSIIGVGGAHLSYEEVDEKLAIRIIRTALDQGVNFLDNSWDYGEGLSEERMGKALKDGYRDKAFVMTKIDGRTKQEAARQLDQSLQRLGVDHIDLVQHHEVIRFEDPDRIFDQDGANQALLEARQAGKLRYIGFTGHKDPHVHLYTMQKAEEAGFKLDTVQMPLNVMDAHFRSFGRLVLPQLVSKGIAALAMKTMADGFILKSGVVRPVECLHYALSQPVSVVITGVDSMEVLDQALEAARGFRPLGDGETKRILDKTRPLAGEGKYEPFKTSTYFDATARNPHWLGEEPQRLRELMD